MIRLSFSTAKPVYLLGCGGHGRVVLDALRAAGITVHGIIDGALPRGERVGGVAIVGGDDYLAQLDPRAAALCIGVGVMPGKPRRAQLFASCESGGFQLIDVIHPSAIISPRHAFGVGIQVLAGAVVQPAVSVGDNVIINTRASIDHDCIIENNVMIAPGATVCGEVRIGAGAYVGAGAVILPGVQIGRDATIGAGSIVTRDVDQGATVTGNPATARAAGGQQHA
jgi:sugar O-acyltransferase (sialic acid O-acetyltransferase NeuD family)